MRTTSLFTSIGLATVLMTGCLPDDDNGNGWNNLGRNCGNGHHADFNFTLEGGESFHFTPSQGETTNGYYASEAGSGTTEVTEFTYGWSNGDDEVSAGFMVKTRLATGINEVASLEEGVLTLLVDRGGQTVYALSSIAFSMEVDEMIYGSIMGGTIYEPVHHAEGSFTGSFLVVQGNTGDTVNVSGNFCLHGYEE